MTVHRDALARSIAGRLLPLSHDELRVLDRVLIGIEQGRDQYGPLDLGTAERDWGAEAAAELRDCIFYLAAQYVSDHDRKIERLRCEALDEQMKRVDAGLNELRAHDWPGPGDLGGEG